MNTRLITFSIIICSFLIGLTFGFSIGKSSEKNKNFFFQQEIYKIG